MANRVWTIDLDGQMHEVALQHSFWSGATVLRIDEKVALDDRPGSAGFADHWFGPTEHLMRLGHHELRLLITPNHSYSFDLIVDGRAVSSGKLTPALPRPPDDAFYRFGKAGASIAVVALPCVLVLTFIFGRFAPEWGPRWFAASDLALASGLLPFMGGFGVYLINRARVRSSIGTRLTWLAFGLVSLWVAVVGAFELPQDIADVIGDPQTLTLTVVDSTTRRSNAPTIQTSDGTTYEWAWAFGLYDYPKIDPGTYQVVLTPARHRIVAIHRVP